MKSKNQNDNLTREINDFVDQVDRTLSSTLKSTDDVIEPIRQSAFRRFPTIFLLLTTFGVATTFYAFERLVGKWEYLYERPWLILIIGLSALVLTGKLYKKLG